FRSCSTTTACRAPTATTSPAKPRKSPGRNPMLKQSIRNNSLVLGLFALVTSVLLASTYLGTKTTIEDAERRAAQKILLELYPASSHDNDLLKDVLPIPEAYLSTLGLKTAANIHVVKKEEKIICFIIPAIAPDGYSGDIRLLIGINV